jgi:hypothetical protein
MIETKKYKEPTGREITREEHTESGAWHRINGPALICSNGAEAWYLHGALHREDGPAIVDPLLNYRAWFLNGEKVRVEFPNGRVFEKSET